MDEYGTVIDEGTVRFRRLLPGPLERVWAYLTESEKRGTWLAGGLLEQQVGGKVELRFHHSDLSARRAATPERYEQFEGGHNVYGTVTACDPLRLLSYTWGEGGGRYSEVTFELERKGTEVLLSVTHRRLEGRDELVSVASGWHTHLDVLSDRLRDLEPEPFWTRHEEREREYEERIAEA